MRTSGTGTLAFAFAHDWSKEVDSFDRGDVPSHRLFGLAGVRSSSRYSARLGSGLRLPARLRSRPWAWRVVEALAITVRQREITGVVCTTETPARSLLVLRRIGLLRRPVVVVSVALTEPRNRSGPHHRFWRLVLPAADGVLVYASAQRSVLAESFGLDPSRVRFVPFGVDGDFFSPDERPEPTWDVVSVGTNAGKDFETLVKALPPEAKVCIVTDPANAEIVRAHGSPSIQLRANVPIAELRELYRSTAVMAIPLRDVEFSSGQTVLLENLAAGTAVCVSAVPGVADYVEPGNNCVAVAPGDIEGWRVALTALLDDPAERRRIGAAAARTVRERFPADGFSDAVMDWFDDLGRGR